MLIISNVRISGVFVKLVKGLILIIFGIYFFWFRILFFIVIEFYIYLFFFMNSGFLSIYCDYWFLMVGYRCRIDEINFRNEMIGFRYWF